MPLPCLTHQWLPSHLDSNPTLSRDRRALYSPVSVCTTNLVSSDSSPCSSSQSQSPPCSSLCSQNSLLPLSFSICHPYAWKMMPLDLHNVSPFSSFLRSLTKCHLLHRLTTLSKIASQPQFSINSSLVLFSS